MHTPNTLAFRIYGIRGMIQQIRKRIAQKQDKPTSLRFYRFSPIITIWHSDPETDHSDDSCGYTYPRITEAEMERIVKEAGNEFQFYFGTEFKTLHLHTASCYEILFSIWSSISWRFFKKNVSPKELIYISDLASNPIDNLRHIIYESKHDKEEFIKLWRLLYRCHKKYHRKWYQHPKWHIHHWEVRFDFLSKLQKKLKPKTNQSV